MILDALVGQFPVAMSVEENLALIREVLAHALPEDLVVLPEGALSGYEAPGLRVLRSRAN